MLVVMKDTITQFDVQVAKGWISRNLVKQSMTAAPHCLSGIGCPEDVFYSWTNMQNVSNR